MSWISSMFGGGGDASTTQGPASEVITNPFSKQTTSDEMSWLLGRPSSSDPYGQLSPEQKALFQNLFPTIEGNINSATPYSGNFTADMTPDEIAAMNQQSRLSSLVGGWANEFQPGVINSELDATEKQNLNNQFYGNGQNPGAKSKKLRPEKRPTSKDVFVAQSTLQFRIVTL